MATKETTITSAAGETDFVRFPTGRGHIGLTGTISGGAVVLIVRPPGSSTNYVADTINDTVISTNNNEAGSADSFFEEISVPRDAQVKLAANASFTGSLTVCVISEDAA